MSQFREGDRVELVSAHYCGSTLYTEEAFIGRVGSVTEVRHDRISVNWDPVEPHHPRPPTRYAWSQGSTVNATCLALFPAVSEQEIEEAIASIRNAL